MREGGREAITHWEIQEAFHGRDGKPVASLLACQLETGRTHQIRVHLAHIGHPLLGDSVYGPHFKTKASHLGPGSQAALAALGRQALHAYLLALEHPQTGEILELGCRICRRIWFSCRTPCERRNDAGLLEKHTLCQQVMAATRGRDPRYPSKCRSIWCMLHLR